MEEQNNLHEYRTGRTQPRKNHNGPVAVLLIAAIFLMGLVSALGLLNIRLFHELENGDDNPVSFIPQSAHATDPADKNTTPSLGMTVLAISPQYQSMYGLPEGLYISRVHRGSSAAKLGLRVGDVLTAFDGTPVREPDALEVLLYTHHAGDQVGITICRNGRFYDLTLTVDQAE